MLKSLESYFDNGEYFLKGVWEYETDRGKHRLTVPKISLGDNFYVANIPMFEHIYGDCTERVYIPSSGNFQVCKDDNDKFYYDELIGPVIKEMSLDDVEKELGYKIKLVSKKEK